MSYESDTASQVSNPIPTVLEHAGDLLDDKLPRTGSDQSASVSAVPAAPPPARLPPAGGVALVVGRLAHRQSRRGREPARVGRLSAEGGEAPALGPWKLPIRVCFAIITVIFF